jgi:ribosomal protein S18 acetylase RimI-like enzyme
LPTEDLALEVMLAAWPPIERERLGDWTLRFAAGFTRRANSVLPAGDPGGSLELAIDACERAYAARALPTSFQLREGHVAEGLEELLAARGYAVEHPSLVLAGPLPASLPDPRVTHRETPSDAWFDTWLEVAERSEPDALELSRAIVGRASRPCTFALLHEQGRPIATALGTLSPGWLGLSCLAVRDEARRRGVARAMLGGLAAWARDRGADGLWLEVEAGNAPALALYDDLGLERIGAYRYRTAASIIRTTP